MSFLNCQSVVDQIRRITSSHCMGWEHWLGFPLGRRGLMFCSVWLVRIMVLTDWLLCNHIKGCKSPNGLGLFFCIHTVEAVFFPLQLISYVLNFHCRYTETKTPPSPSHKNLHRNLVWSSTEMEDWLARSVPLFLPFCGFSIFFFCCQF